MDDVEQCGTRGGRVSGRESALDPATERSGVDRDVGAESGTPAGVTHRTAVAVGVVQGYFSILGVHLFGL